jgi:uncharacterized protein (DUF433 family)
VWGLHQREAGLFECCAILNPDARIGTMGTRERIAHIVRDELGAAWVDGKNVKVVEVVQEHLARGWSIEKIQEQHPQLSLAEIYSALAFYYDHPQEFQIMIVRETQVPKAVQAGESSRQERLRALFSPQ